MTTSNIYVLSRTAIEVIQDAYEVLQAAGDGETLSDTSAQLARKSLNLLLKEWETAGLHLWTYTEASLFLEKGKAEYDFTTAHLANSFVESTTTNEVVRGDTKFIVEDANNFSVGNEICLVKDDADAFFSLITAIVDVRSFDILTADYANASFSIAAQTSAGKTIRYSAGGLKMWLCEAANFIYTYTLTTAFDISTATLSAESFDTSTQTTLLHSIDFNADFTKLYALDASSIIYAYDLLTAADVSSAIYAGELFDFSLILSEQALGLLVYDNNTRFAVSTQALPTQEQALVYSGTLSTAGDFSTAAFDNKTLQAAQQAQFAEQMTFDDTGTIFFLCTATPGVATYVNQYTLSTAYDLSSASADIVTFSTQQQDISVASVAFNTAGTRMSALGLQNNAIYDYTLESKSKKITVADIVTSDAQAGSIIRAYDPDFIPVVRILRVRRRDLTDYEIPIVFASRADYFNLPAKATLGTPIQAYFSRQNPNGIMYLWNTPNSSVQVINFTYERPMQIINDLQDSLDLPQQWYKAVVYNLAVEMFAAVGCSAERIAFIKDQADSALARALAFDQALYPLQVELPRYG